MSFFYSFTETLLHSLWQSGLCVLVYTGSKGILKNIHPLRKRNFLFGLLGAQLIISLITFFIYFTGFNAPVQSLYTNSLTAGFYRYGDIIFYTYIIVVAFHAIRLSTHWSGFKMKYREGITRPSPELKVFTELKAYHLGIKRKVSLWYSVHIDTPMTFGMLKPVILLPLSLVNHISMQETEAIILHELAHIKSKDYLLNHLLVIVETLYFFNPFIRVIAKEIRLEREKNCDVQVINFDYPELVYAEALLKAARHSHAVKTFQVAAVTGKAQLLKRIEFFTGESKPVFNKSNGVLSALFISFFMIAALFFLPGITATKQAEPVNANAATATLTLESPAIVHAAGMSDAKKITTVYAAASANSASAPAEAADEEDMIPAVRVAFNEKPDSVKEFIYKVETAQGEMTQSFRLTLIKGQWQMQPQWMVLETPPDSLAAGKCPADTVFHVNDMPQ